MESREDVVVVSGGELVLGETERRVLIPLPEETVETMHLLLSTAGIPGCRVEPLLVAAGLPVPVVQGLVAPEAARGYFRVAEAEGIRVPPLHLGHRALPESLLSSVARILLGPVGAEPRGGGAPGRFEGASTKEPSRVILETCAEAIAIGRFARASGHDVRVVPGALVRSLGVGSRGVKNDRKDARVLSESPLESSCPRSTSRASPRPSSSR
jgi:hypothetical protein